MKYKFEFKGIQLYWEQWRLPWYAWEDADEYGPAEFYCGIGPLQMIFYAWRQR